MLSPQSELRGGRYSAKSKGKGQLPVAELEEDEASVFSIDGRLKAPEHAELPPLRPEGGRELPGSEL